MTIKWHMTLEGCEVNSGFFPTIWVEEQLEKIHKQLLPCHGTGK